MTPDNSRPYSPRWEAGEAMSKLNSPLHLPARGNEQDWAVELADASRVDEFCDVYEDGTLDVEERFALMSLIIASYDDLLRRGDWNERPYNTQYRIERLLRCDFILHVHTVAYWCCLDTDEPEDDPDDPEWVFAVTPWLRRIWSDCWPLPF